MLDKIFIFLLCFYFGSAKIKINNLKVPQSIELGSADDIILDCEFEAEGENSIVIKWFVNGSIPIYQWIPERADIPPQRFVKMKDIIDVDYKVTDNKNTMYRALHITNVSPDLTGNYSCKVSGDTDEDVATKTMTIYEPAESGLNLALDDFGSVVICSASGMFPKPNMNLYITNENETEIFFDEEDVDVELYDNDYNITATLYFDFSNVSNPFYYICELEIPGTNYSLREKKAYFVENDNIETQIEEDYTNLYNSTNSTESSLLKENQESAEIETQIEEDSSDNADFNTTSTAEIPNNSDEKSSEELTNLIESSSASHLPGFTVYLVLIVVALFKTVQRTC